MRFGRACTPARSRISFVTTRPAGARLAVRALRAGSGRRAGPHLSLLGTGADPEARDLVGFVAAPLRARLSSHAPLEPGVYDDLLARYGARGRTVVWSSAPRSTYRFGRTSLASSVAEGASWPGRLPARVGPPGLDDPGGPATIPVGSIERVPTMTGVAAGLPNAAQADVPSGRPHAAHVPAHRVVPEPPARRGRHPQARAASLRSGSTPSRADQFPAASKPLGEKRRPAGGGRSPRAPAGSATPWRSKRCPCA